MNTAKDADLAARTREQFVYSIVKITRLYDRHIFGEIHEVRKGLWAFFS